MLNRVYHNNNFNKGFKMLKLQIYSESELIYGESEYLTERFDITEEDIEQCSIDMWDDCDMIKVDNEIFYFITCFDKDKNITYIITYDEPYDLPKKAFRMLLSLFEGGSILSRNSLRYNRHYNDNCENSWKSWESMENGIAWRGGSGVCIRNI